MFVFLGSWLQSIPVAKVDGLVLEARRGRRRFSLPGKSLQTRSANRVLD